MPSASSWLRHQPRHDNESVSSPRTDAHRSRESSTTATSSGSVPELRCVDPEVGGERSARSRKTSRNLHADERMRLLALAAHPRQLDAGKLARIAHEVLRAHYVRERAVRRT